MSEEKSTTKVTLYQAIELVGEKLSLMDDLNKLSDILVDRLQGKQPSPDEKRETTLISISDPVDTLLSIASQIENIGGSIGNNLQESIKIVG